VKIERKADHAASEASCKSATGKTIAEWFKALDSHGGVALGRRIHTLANGRARSRAMVEQHRRQ
jgi:hypothetical protein